MTKPEPKRRYFKRKTPEEQKEERKKEFSQFLIDTPFPVTATDQEKYDAFKSFRKEKILKEKAEKEEFLRQRRLNYDRGFRKRRKLRREFSQFLIDTPFSATTTEDEKYAVFQKEKLKRELRQFLIDTPFSITTTGEEKYAAFQRLKEELSKKVEIPKEDVSDGHCLLETLFAITNADAFERCNEANSKEVENRDPIVEAPAPDRDEFSNDNSDSGSTRDRDPIVEAPAPGRDEFSNDNSDSGSEQSHDVSQDETTGVKISNPRRERKMWTNKEEAILVDVWPKYDSELCGLKRSSHIFAAMAQELKIRGLDLTAREIKNKVAGWRQRYKLSMRRVFSGYPLNWHLFGDVDKKFEDLRSNYTTLEEDHFDDEGFRLQFDEQIPDDERRFYLKVYPTVNGVSDRKPHCTVCGVHIGTAPANESVIRMHPILKVTHCKKCHEFYNSGEFSKGEDGSELYCRWCGQGGEVYCCSKCPYVFCTNCIVQNLSKDCVNDIEENENWNCFVCAPKIMWHLRAQHWALMNFIEKQKQDILDKNLTESSIRKLMIRDSSICCKSKSSGNVSDSSCDSESSISRKRKLEKKSLPMQTPLQSQLARKMPKVEDTMSPDAKKSKLNDEVVCTPDVLSLIAQGSAPTANKSSVTAGQQTNGTNGTQHPAAEKPKPPPAPTPHLQAMNRPVQIQPVQPQPQQQPTMTLHQPVQPTTTPISGTFQISQLTGLGSQAPPLAIRTLNPSAPLRGATPALITKKTVVGTRTPITTPGQSPVYHTINGFRIDLNSAAQQETFRLPNGKLIQVKRQGTTNQGPVTVPISSAPQNTPGFLGQGLSQISRPPQLAQIQPASRPIQPAAGVLNTPAQTQTVQQFTIQQPSLATIRYAPATGQLITTNGAPIQTTAQQPNILNHVLNGTNPGGATLAIRPALPQQQLFKQIFVSTPLGQARTQLQNQIFGSMDICQHLIGKIHTLTNSNAYKMARNFTDVKELYIHLSYLFTYAIGRFKTIQEKCMDDMRILGFAGDAATLESGQLEKYASDNDEDDIVIVEPKTTLIDLDSDEDDDQSASQRNSKKPPPSQPPKQSIQAGMPIQTSSPSLARSSGHLTPQQLQKIQRSTPPLVAASTKPPPLLIKPLPSSTIHHRPEIVPPTPITPTVQAPPLLAMTDNGSHTTPSPTPSLAAVETMECDLDFTANLLAGMLDVELHEGSETVQITQPPKKPRKKTTNKPNPHLIKQQQIQAREREQERIKHDAKLNRACLISLERIDEKDENAKKLLEDYMQGGSTNDSSSNGIDSPAPRSVDSNSHEKDAEMRNENASPTGEDSKTAPSEDSQDASSMGNGTEITQENDASDKVMTEPETEDSSSKDSNSNTSIDKKPASAPSSPKVSQDESESKADSPAVDPAAADSAAADSAAADSSASPNEANCDNAKDGSEKAPSELKETEEITRKKTTSESSKLNSPEDDEDNEQIELLEVIDQGDDEVSEIADEDTAVDPPKDDDKIAADPLEISTD